MKSLQNKFEYVEDIEDKNTIEVYINDEKEGTLEFDPDQKAWVFWPTKIDDGITYWESLKETKSSLEDDYNYPSL